MCGPGLIVPLIFPQTATESARARRGAAERHGSSQARTKSRGGQPIHRARRLGPQGEAGDDAMLGLVLAALNPVLKPLYDAFYRVFLMVRSRPRPIPPRSDG